MNNPEKALAQTSSEWRDETPERKNAVSNFLSKHYGSPHEERPRYDSINDLHLSGGNIKAMKKIVDGSAEIIRVEVFYDGEEPAQIHVVADKDGSIDFYIKGKALEDFLSQN